MTRIWGMVLLLAVPGVLCAEPGTDSARIGVASSVKGMVTAASPGAQPRTLRGGGPVFLGDRLTTDDLGQLQILLLDETVFSVGPKTALILDRFIFDPDKKTGELAASVVTGFFRLISGRLGSSKKNPIKVTLPVGTMGIHGTDVMARVSGEETAIILRSGKVTVSNAAGTVVLDRPGYATILGAGGPPALPFQAPAALQDSLIINLSSVFGGAGTLLQALPGNVIASVESMAAQTSPEMEAAFKSLSLDELSRADLFPEGAVSRMIDLIGMQGVGAYSGSAAFNPGPVCNLGPASNCTGTWSANLTVDFGARTASERVAIVTPLLNTDQTLAATFTGDGGVASQAIALTAVPGPGTCTPTTCSASFSLINSGAVPAARAEMNVGYNDGFLSGTGDPIASDRQ